MGARAYRYLSLYEPSPGCLVEIGSERGEGSTAYLDAYARRSGLRFYSADIDPGVYAKAREITSGARLVSGVDLLRRLRSEISVAYLDGFDWIPRDEDGQAWIARQRARYREMGFQLTNENCQHEHLAEARLVAEKAATRCAVICDDTWQDGGWTGKGGLAVPYLQAQGFEVVDHDKPAGDSLGYAVLKRG